MGLPVMGDSAPRFWGPAAAPGRGRGAAVPGSWPGRGGAPPATSGLLTGPGPPAQPAAPDQARLWRAPRRRRRWHRRAPRGGPVARRTAASPTTPRASKSQTAGPGYQPGRRCRSCAPRSTPPPLREAAAPGRGRKTRRRATVRRGPCSRAWPTRECPRKRRRRPSTGLLTWVQPLPRRGARRLKLGSWAAHLPAGRAWCRRPSGLCRPHRSVPVPRPDLRR